MSLLGGKSFGGTGPGFHEQTHRSSVRALGAGKVVVSTGKLASRTVPFATTRRTRSQFGGEFFGYFMVRKVIAGQDLLRATGMVKKKLAT